MFYQQLVQPLINSNMNVNLGVLETAHSIFYSSVRARALSCSARAQQISRAIFPAFEMSIKLHMATQDPFMCRLIDLYYDLTCQDLAPEFEDCHETFFAGGSGYFMQLMACHSSRQMYVMDASHSPVPFARRLDVSHVQPDEPTPSLPSKVRTGVIEIAKVRLARPLSSAFSFD